MKVGGDIVKGQRGPGDMLRAEVLKLGCTFNMLMSGFCPLGRSQDVTAFQFAAQVEKHWPRAFAGASISPCVPVHSLCVYTWCLLE